MRLYYTLKTIDPIIVSENNSTENNDACLDYIPGSAILGALASRHYSEFEDHKSWQLFHTGDTVFSHCYPIIENQLALPTPASWHFAKGENAIDKSGRYDAKQISNQASNAFERQAGTQYKQCRDGYINSNANSATVEQGLTTKTAIDYTTGGAKESQLFSYAFIKPAQTFLGWIECPDEMADVFKNSLTQGLHIGRSRNSEFGRVAINLIDAPTIKMPKNNDKTLVIWCLSDCECLNNEGDPTFTPSLANLHPQLSGKLIREKSFIRSTHCSRFNQKRAGLDSEQMLIGKGSVLVYQLDQKAPQAILDDLNQKGIGLNKQQGLGWISINPEWAFQAQLTPESPLFNAINITSEPEKKDNTTIKTPLLNWISEKLTGDEQAIRLQQQVNVLLADVVMAYRSARRYNNILNSNEAGPSSNQWRRISSIIREKENNWSQAVFQGEHAICKANNDQLGWGINWSQSGQLTDFATFIQNLLGAQSVNLMRELLEKINRYDLSTLKGLTKMCKELGIEPVPQTVGNDHD